MADGEIKSVFSKLVYLSARLRVFIWLPVLLSPLAIAQDFSFDSEETTLEAPADDKASALSPIEERLDDDYSVALRRFDAGEFAEAGSLFDRVFEDTGDQTVLLRAGLAWNEGGFFAAAYDRFMRWRKLAVANMGADQVLMVNQLLAKVKTKILSVELQFPDDVYRPRKHTLSIRFTRLSDGFTPASKTIELVPSDAKAKGVLVTLDVGRWLFEIEHPAYAQHTETIEVFDGSPLLISPLPAVKMPSEKARSDQKLAYREGLDLFRANAFASALKTMLSLAPRGFDSEEGLWLFGRTAERAEYWADAMLTYERLLTLHPESIEAETIKVKLKDIRIKANASRAKVSLLFDPPGATYEVFRSGQRTPLDDSGGLLPGRYEIEATWPNGVRHLEKIEVKPNENQTVTVFSQASTDANSALRWQISGVFLAGASQISGNQSDWVTLDGGWAGSLGAHVNWAWKKRLSLTSGLRYRNAQHSFYVRAGGDGLSGTGHWSIHHVIVPIGMRWTSDLDLHFSGGLDVEFLVDAREEFAGQRSIAQRLKPLNVAPFMTVEHSINVFSKPLALYLRMSTQLLGMSVDETTLRQNQVLLGASYRLY